MSVIILHHAPDVTAHPGKQEHCAESNAGVMDEVQAVAEALGKLGVPFVTKSIRRLVDLRPTLAGCQEHVVFNLVEELEGHPQDPSVVPSIVRSLGKGFTGNDSYAMMLGLDKWRTKAVLASMGLPTPPAFFVPVGEKLTAKLTKGRYIIKPAYTDASEGITAASVVDAASREFSRLIKHVHESFHQPAIVEKFIDGRELNVTTLEFADGPRPLPIAEIDFSAFKAGMPRIVDYDAKWRSDTFVYKNTPRIIPTKLPAKTAKDVRRLTVGAWNAIGCRGYARVDFRLDKNRQPWIIEVNPNPDISPEGGLAAAVNAAGLTYEEFVQMMYEQAGGKMPAKSKKATANKSGKADKPHVDIQPAGAADRDEVLAFMEDTKFFRANEMVIAAEVYDAAAKQGPHGDYQSFVAKVGGKAVGWVCYGETPCTLGTYDVYWLAVDPKCQGLGIGKKLMEFAEAGTKSAGGRIIIVETSGSERYLPTRAFYLKIGYKEAARVDDFYAPGDAKIIYTKPA
jgi:D-alanine-D-alanine ligase